jgi:hypothetical protein
MNNLVAFSNNSALQNLASFVADEATQSVQFLKFTKDGLFVYGMEEAVVAADEEFQVDMDSLSRGWICWKDGRPVDEVMVPVAAGNPPRRNELDDYGPYEDGGGWREQVAINFVSFETGETLAFKSSSSGGRNAIATLSKSFMDRLRSGKPDVIPVVNMVPSSYKHQKFGKINVPTFKVIDWIKPDGADFPDAEVVEVEVVEEQAKPEGQARRSRRSM